MTYVKRRGMVLLIDDSQVPKYTGDGFEVLGKPQETPEKEAGTKDGKTGK